MPSLLSPWKKHKEKWKYCDRCELHKRRTHTALLRCRKFPSNIPYIGKADVLFIGEAPGPVEDQLGSPFTGPLGQDLDSIIERAFVGLEVRYALTNLIACIPLEDNRAKFTKPPEWAIKKCRPRLIEIIRIVKPQLIVQVGDEAKKYMPKVDSDYSVVHIPHPGKIARTNLAAQGMMVRNCIVTLREAVEELGIGE